MFATATLHETFRFFDYLAFGGTFWHDASFAVENHTSKRGRVMAHRVKVRDMVFEMHEKNLVLLNILRDIVENERSTDLFESHHTDPDIYRMLNDKAARRNEIVSEIEHFLHREKLKASVSANSNMG